MIVLSKEQRGKMYSMDMFSSKNMNYDEKHLSKSKDKIEIFVFIT